MRTTLLATILSLAGAVTLAHADSVTCTDGTTSRAGRGACSRHGGVAEPRTERNTEPTLVRCLDGKLSRSSGRGTCSGHGGVMGPGVIPTAPTSSPPRRDTTTTARITGARCADGTTSKATGRGACSRHGGLAPQTSRMGEPIARCRDGWVSYSQHRGGSCATHGGVRDWLGG